MTLHTILPDTRTLHGHFSRELPPVLTIDSGDRVRFTTLDAAWCAFEQANPFERPVKFAPRDTQRDRGHALCGPVEVRGAEPGKTLEVRILEVRPGRWGWTSAGGYTSPLNEKLGLADPPEHVLRWSIDADAGRATDPRGRTIALRPFAGQIGMPPDAPGSHSTFPPRPCGGNIDCRELVAGSTLWLPIPVSGGLLSVGDGHGVQGDGEVAGPALECPLEVMEVEIHVREAPKLSWPRAETPAGWIAFGFHEDLDEAMAIALGGMLDLMVERFGCERKEALALASLVVSLRVTQVVNGVRGVHALLPHGALDGMFARHSAFE